VVDPVALQMIGVIVGALVAALGVWLAVLSSMHERGWRHWLRQVGVAALGAALLAVSIGFIFASLPSS
jgi:hypothetical protein